MIFRCLIVAMGILLETPPVQLQIDGSSGAPQIVTENANSDSPATDSLANLLTSSVAPATDVPEEQFARVSNCPDGWYEVGLQVTRRQATANHRCVKFVSEPDTFEKAQEKCAQDGSFLVSIGFGSAMPSDLYAGQANITGQSFWTGLQLINNAFYWDGTVPARHTGQSALCPGCKFQSALNVTTMGYPSVLSSCTKVGGVDEQRPVLARSFSTSSAKEFGWGCEESPLRDGCVSARFASNVTPNQGEPTLIFSDESCQTKLPYFCLIQLVGSYSFIEDPDCGKPWMYNSYDGFSYAYFGNSSSKSYSEAKAACEAVNSTLSPASTAENLNVLTNFIRDQAVEIYAESGGSSSRSCKVLRFNQGNVSTAVAGCSRELPFTCRKTCGGTAFVTLQYYSNSSSLRCSTSTKMSGPVFWLRNGAYWPDQQPNTTPVGGLASYRCGFFDSRKTTRRIWSNAVLASNLDDSLASYRVLIVLNTTFDQVLLNYVYSLPWNEEATPPAIQWINDFTNSLITDVERQNETAELIGISKLTTTTTLVYLDLTLYEESQTKENVTGTRQRLWDIAKSMNEELQLQAVDLIVRTPFHCLDSLVPLSSKQFVHPSTAMIGDWASLGTCGSDGTISCSGNFATGAFWDTSSWYLNASSRDQECIMDVLRNLSQELREEKNVVIVLKVLVSLTDSAEGLHQNTTALIGEVVSKAVAAVGRISFQEHLLETPYLVGTIISNLMNANSSDVFDQQSRTNTSFQRSLEEAVMWLMKKASSAMGNSSAINSTLLSFSSRNLAFTVDLEDGNLGMTVTGPSETTPLPPLVLLNATAADVSGKESTVLVFSQRYANTPKAYIVYANSMLFRSLTRKWTAKHRVISAQLLYPLETEIQNDVTISTFRDFIEEEDRHLVACGFWDFKMSNWSLSGCIKNMTADGSIICSCNHLTNYAVLLDTNPLPTSQESERALTIVTYVGLGLSIAGLSAVIVSFIALRDMRKTNPQKVFFNLSISLLSLNIVFLVGIDQTESHNGCIAVAALLHYFLLTSFAWMLVEAIDQYLRFVKVLGAYVPRFLIKTSIPAWGIPGVVVAVICAIRSDLYYNSLYCLPQPTVLQFAVALPAGAVLVINVVLFSMVLRNVCCLRKTVHMHHNQSERRQMLLHGQAGLAMSCVLGLTWLFGYLQIPQVSALRLTAQWVFCICNSIQGFLIFIFFCALKQSFWQSWTRACCRLRLTRQNNISLDDLLRSSTGTKSTMMSRDVISFRT